MPLFLNVICAGLMQPKDACWVISHTTKILVED